MITFSEPGSNPVGGTPNTARFIFTLTLCLVLYHVNAQAPDAGENGPKVDSIDLIYGSDPTIYNGNIYVNPNPGARGNPFLRDLDFVEGSTVVRDQHFDKLYIRYDLFGQKLVLKYRNKMGGIQYLAVSDAWIQGFSLAGMQFERFSFPDGSKNILQVLGNEDSRIGIFHRKELLFNAGNTNPGYYYSPEILNYFLIRPDGIIPFKNNRTFIHLFPKSKQSEVSAWIKREKIDIKKASDSKLIALIHFCNNLK